MRELQPTELKELLSAQPLTLLDVREDDEWAIAHIEGSRHIPMGQVLQRLDEIRHLSQVVVICHHGVRSLRVGRFLEQNGITDIAHLSGGLAAWAEQVDPGMPQY